MTENLKKLLLKELQLLEDAAQVLRYSFDKCTRIGLKDEYTPDELESFESRSFLLRGKEAVSGEWSLACIAYNIKKMHKLAEVRI